MTKQKIFATCKDTRSTADMAYSLLAKSICDMLKEDIKGRKVVDEGQFLADNLGRAMMRAQARVEFPPTIIVSENGGDGHVMSPLDDAEVNHAAAVIVAAFLNPQSVNLDYQRYSETKRDQQKSGKYHLEACVGLLTKPAIVADIHGRIILWYLPGLLLPHRVTELNNSIKYIRGPLCDTFAEAAAATAAAAAAAVTAAAAANSDTANSDTTTASAKKKKKKNESPPSWRLQNFTHGPDSYFGAGKLSLSIGNFPVGHTRLEDRITSSSNINKEPIQDWLRFIEPVERLLNGVLQIVHPGMYEANSMAVSLLLKNQKSPLLWPTIYPGLDIVANRATRSHRDPGGANTFYDHLVNLGWDTDVELCLEDLNGKFAYAPGTCVLFSGASLTHSVTAHSKERVVLAHYSNEKVQGRLGVARPVLPTQLGWWKEHS